MRSTDSPQGALLLSLVAVSHFPLQVTSYLTSSGQCEHALRQYEETREILLSPRRRDNHFSGEVWNDAAHWYQVGISNLSSDSWDLIIDGSWKISQEKKASRIPSNSMDPKMPDADERELLAEGDEAVEDDEIVGECESFYHRSQILLTVIL
jgi:hypothetical protein